MGKMGKFNCKGLKDFQKKLEKLQDSEEFVESCAKELAAQLYALVVEKTPIGDYNIYVEVTARRDSKNHKKGDKYMKAESTGKDGGTLQRGWTIGSITKEGNTIKVEIINPVEYASYVEYGHVQTPGRYVPAIGKTLKRAWVEGKLMMTESEQALERITPKVLENKIKRYLRECLK